MKIRALLCVVLALLVARFAHAAEPVPARKSAAPAASAARKAIVYESAPFDITREKLPAVFAGHSILGLLEKLAPPGPKGEFEKTEEHEARVARWRSMPYAGRITPGDLLAFQVSPLLVPNTLKLAYDADREEMAVTLAFENHYFDVEPQRWLETFLDAKSLGTRAAVTRLGVKFNVTTYQVTRVGLGIPEQLEDISFSLPVPRADAPRMKFALRAYLVGTLAAPYKIERSSSTTASLTRPVESVTRTWGLSIKPQAIWFVDGGTGEVLRKIEAPFPQCSYGIC